MRPQDWAIVGEKHVAALDNDVQSITFNSPSGHRDDFSTIASWNGSVYILL